MPMVSPQGRKFYHHWRNPAALLVAAMTSLNCMTAVAILAPTHGVVLDRARRVCHTLARQICHTRARHSAQYATPGRDTLPNMPHHGTTLCARCYTKARHSAQYVTQGRDTLPDMPVGRDTVPNMPHHGAPLWQACHTRARHSAQYVTPTLRHSA